MSTDPRVLNMNRACRAYAAERAYNREAATLGERRVTSEDRYGFEAVNRLIAEGRLVELERGTETTNTTRTRIARERAFIRYTSAA